MATTPSRSPRPRIIDITGTTAGERRKPRS
jgi:hypothetical protein